MRVLKDHHARTAIEVRVATKWTTIIVLNGGPHFEQLRNELVAATWSAMDYDVAVAARHFLSMQQYFEISDACKRELKAIGEGSFKEKERPVSLKTVIRDALLEAGSLTLSGLIERAASTDAAIRNALSDLKNPKYCGPAGTLITEIKEGVVYVRS